MSTRFSDGVAFRDFTWGPYSFVDYLRLDNPSRRALASRFKADALTIYGALTPFPDGEVCNARPELRAEIKALEVRQNVTQDVASRRVYEARPDNEANPHRQNARFAVYRDGALCGGFVLYNGTRNGFWNWYTMIGATFDVQNHLDTYFERVGELIDWLIHDAALYPGDGDVQVVRFAGINFPQDRVDQQWLAHLHVPHIPTRAGRHILVQPSPNGEELILKTVFDGAVAFNG